MELERTERRNRSAPARAIPSKGEQVQQQSSPLQRTSRSDRMTLSRQALAYLEEQNQQAQEQARLEAERKTNGKSEEEQALDLLNKSLKAMKKCEKIAARIMAGDKVPPEDERYLAENDMEGYRMALALRRPKKDPKEWKSVLEDEDRKSASEDNGSEEGPSDVEAEASPAESEL